MAPCVSTDDKDIDFAQVSEFLQQTESVMVPCHSCHKKCDVYDKAHVEWLLLDEMLDYQVEYTAISVKVHVFELLHNNSHLECQNEYR